MATEVTETDLNRRHLLRGGAVLAGAAGIAALGAVGAPTASAADGAPVLQGVNQTATSTTGLEIDAPTGGSDATLALRNNDGPSLFLQPLAGTWDDELELGEIANTEYGPLLGVEDYSGDLQTGFLATNFDLAALPIPVAVDPKRLADTRTTAGRAGIVRRSSSSALDSSNRLKAGSWIDVGIAPTNEDQTIDSVFANITVAGSLTAGYIQAYPPGDRPATSTVNFAKGQIITNGAFVLAGVAPGFFVIRIFAQATTHVIVDVTGLSIYDVPGPDAPGAVARRAAQQGRGVRSAKRSMPTLGVR